MMEQSVYSETEQSAWVEDYTWVGIVRPQDVGPKVAFITPLAFRNQDEAWQPRAENERSQDFPNNGKVAYFTSDFPEQKKSLLYAFWPKRIRQSTVSETIPSTDSRRSYYHTPTYDEITPASELLAQVFDWTVRASDLFGIPQLLSQGIPASNCLSHTIFIRYENQVYGPIRLEADVNDAQMLKPREYTQRSNTAGQPLLVDGYAFVKDTQVLLLHQPFIDQKLLGSPVSQTDWSLPQMTIKRLLRASKAVSLELQKKVHLVEREINELAEFSAANGPESLQIKPCVIERARSIIQRQRESLDGLHAWIEELPETHPLLEKARAVEVQHRKRAIAQQCAEEQSRLQTLHAEEQAAQKDLLHLRNEIQVAHQQHEQLTADLAVLEASIPKRLAEQRQAMLSLLTDLQLISVLSQPHAGENTPEAERSCTPSADQRQNYFSTEKVTTIASPYEIHWRDTAERNNTSTKLAHVCASALLAGLLPVDDALALSPLQAVAQCIAGQRIWRVPVPLTASAPLDIFGYTLVDTHAFLPASGELADILIEAHDHPEQLGLIVLEGIDRVPFLPVIEPLLRHYRARRRQMRRAGEAFPGQERLQLFHPLALAPANPYQQISTLAWPANLLLAVTFDGDIGSFPLPARYAPWFAHIDRITTGDITYTPTSGEQKNWQVATTSWYAWEKDFMVQANNQKDRMFLKDRKPEQQRFYAAMDFLKVPKDMLAAIITQCWPEQ